MTCFWQEITLNFNLNFRWITWLSVSGLWCSLIWCLSGHQGYKHDKCRCADVLCFMCCLVFSYRLQNSCVTSSLPLKVTSEKFPKWRPLTSFCPELLGDDTFETWSHCCKFGSWSLKDVGSDQTVGVYQMDRRAILITGLIFYHKYNSNWVF